MADGLRRENPVIIVDVKGQICPYPIINTRKELKNVKQGEVIQVVTDNPPTANETLPQFCQLKNYPYEKVEESSGIWRFFIKKTD